MPMLQPYQQDCVVEGMVTAQADTKTSPGADTVTAEVLFDTFFRVRLLTTLFSSFFLFSIWQLVPLVSAAGYWDW